MAAAQGAPRCHHGGASDAAGGGGGSGGGGGELGYVQAFFAARGLVPPPFEPGILVACERSGRVRDAYLA